MPASEMEKDVEQKAEQEEKTKQEPQKQQREVFGEVVLEVAKTRKADPVTNILAVKDNEDDLAEWAATREELVDWRYPQYYVCHHTDKLHNIERTFFPNVPSMSTTLP